jgi:hypothetical protein
LQVFQRLKLFAFEFHFHITDSKEITWTDIRAVGSLKGMVELAPLETILGVGQLMECGITKTHHRFWRMCSSAAVQDLTEKLRYLLEEIATVDLLFNREL